MLNEKQIRENVREECPGMKHRRVIEQAIKDAIKEYKDE